MSFLARIERSVHAGELAEPIASARGSWTRREGVLVRVVDADGRVGCGEASPLPGYSPDTLAQCVAELSAVQAGAITAPAGPMVEWAAGVLDAAGLTAPAARFALETALYDLVARQRGTSIAALLSDAPAAEVALSALVADLPAARAAVARGISSIKLKIGRPGRWEHELGLVRALRAELGPGVALRLDAGQAWTLAEAPARLAALAAFAPEYVEEPVAELLRLGRAPVPIAADESLQTPGAWRALAATCQAFVLKPTTLGGLGACLQMARESRLPCAVSHTFEGPVALAAALELARALPRPLAAGLAPHAGLAAWPS